eukprot:6213881-Pleurochrysis_carterae.AAC.2
MDAVARRTESARVNIAAEFLWSIELLCLPRQVSKRSLVSDTLPSQSTGESPDMCHLDAPIDKQRAVRKCARCMRGIFRNAQLLRASGACATELQLAASVARQHRLWCTQKAQGAPFAGYRTAPIGRQVQFGSPRLGPSTLLCESCGGCQEIDAWLEAAGPPLVWKLQCRGLQNTFSSQHRGVNERKWLRLQALHQMIVRRPCPVRRHTHPHRNEKVAQA